MRQTKNKLTQLYNLKQRAIVSLEIELNLTPSQQMINNFEC